MALSRFLAVVVGTGFIGPVHVEALPARHPRNRHRRLDPQRGAEQVRRLSLPRAYADLAELLADPEVQVVHLCSPNHLHFEQCRRVLAAGKHLICEKPLALTSTETAELVELAEQPQW